jgi:hypothetical protein
VLDVAVITACDLFQRGDAGLEMSEANAGLQQRETKINLPTSNGANGPLCVVVPELLVPMVKWLGGKELAWFGNRTIWQVPVSPEGKVDPIQSETLLDFLDIRLEVPGINIFGDGIDLRECDGS